MMTSDRENREVLCGIGSFRPKWLQFMNNPKAMCAFLSIYMFLHGFIVMGVHNINTTSFERRFHLSSAQAGWAASTNDISAAILGPLIGFYAAKRYKARWLALSVVVGGVGFILIGLPHFLTGLYEWGQSDERICRRGDAACSDIVNTDLSGYLYLIMFGMFLIGIPGATQLTVGMSYIDDSVPVNSSPLYRGIVHCMLCVGLAAGFVAGGQSLKLYVDFDKTSTDRMIITPQDPRWVGAWWLPYFVVTFLYLFLFIAFSLYGSELPTAKGIREEREKALSFDNATTEGPNSEKSITSKTESNEQKRIIFSNDKTIQELHNGVEMWVSVKPGNETIIANEINENFPSNMMKNGTKEVYADATEESLKKENKSGKQGLEGTTVSLNGSVQGAKESLNYEEDENLNDHKADTVPRNNKNDIENSIGDEQKTAKKVVSREFFSSMVKILRSPVFVFSTLAATCLFLILTALTVFFPKVVQNQFNQTAARSGLLAGVILVPGAAVGQVLGGFLMNKFTLRIRGSLILSLITTAAALPLVLVMLAYCEGRGMAGWDLPYHGNTSISPSSGVPDFESTCNHDCHCQLDLYEPVCDSNQKKYFSPCFAGCSVVQSSENQTYSNCSCLQQGNSSAVVTADACQYGCDKMYYVLPVLFVGLILANCMYIPVQTVLLRIHSDVDKTFSLGLMWFFVRLFGQIPGPIILGAALDDTCIVWGETCRNDITSCWVYENNLLARNLTIFSVVVCFGTLVMLILAYIFYQRSAIRYKDVEEKSDSSVYENQSPD